MEEEDSILKTAEITVSLLDLGVVMFAAKQFLMDHAAHDNDACVSLRQEVMESYEPLFEQYKLAFELIQYGPEAFGDPE